MSTRSSLISKSILLPNYTKSEDPTKYLNNYKKIQKKIEKVVDDLKISFIPNVVTIA